MFVVFSSNSTFPLYQKKDAFKKDLYIPPKSPFGKGGLGQPSRADSPFVLFIIASKNVCCFLTYCDRPT